MLKTTLFRIGVSLVLVWFCYILIRDFFSFNLLLNEYLGDAFYKPPTRYVSFETMRLASGIPFEIIILVLAFLSMDDESYNKLGIISIVLSLIFLPFWFFYFTY